MSDTVKEVKLTSSECSGEGSINFKLDPDCKSLIVTQSNKKENTSIIYIEAKDIVYLSSFLSLCVAEVKGVSNV